MNPYTERLEQYRVTLSNMQDGWDGKGSFAPTYIAIKIMIDTLNEVLCDLSNLIPHWYVVPVCTGGLQFEFELPNKSGMEFSVGPEGETFLWRYDKGFVNEVEIPDPHIGTVRESLKILLV